MLSSKVLRMKNLTFVLALIFWMFLTVLMSSCQKDSSDLMDPSQLIPTAPINGEEWLYVALGDSEALCCGKKTYPDYYADFIEQDLGVNVTLNNLAVNGSTSQDLLEQLEEESVQSLLAEARVVTIVTTLNDLFKCEMRDTPCIEAQLLIAMKNYQNIIDKVLSLTPAGETIIRIQTYDNPLVGNWKSLGIFEERNVMFVKWNQSIRDIADRNQILYADVYLDFNGLNGDEDAAEKGYIALDQFHNNEAGALRIAELLRDLGYAPLSP
jgi:lysophospholipase L1-like esterase